MPRSILELRYFRLRVGEQVERATEYLRQHLIPACERAGVAPPDCFASHIAADMPFVLTVAGYPSLADFGDAHEKLAFDFAYTRMDSCLLRAFPGFPEAPPAGKQIFELRTYELPDDKALARKIRMFCEDGEIAIFRRLGIAPVFFGETIVGPRRPSISYLTAFDDLGTRDRLWKAFVADPEWHRVHAAVPELVSNRTHAILRPLPFSPIRQSPESDNSLNQSKKHIGHG